MKNAWFEKTIYGKLKPQFRLRMFFSNLAVALWFIEQQEPSTIL